MINRKQFNEQVEATLLALKANRITVATAKIRIDKSTDAYMGFITEQQKPVPALSGGKSLYEMNIKLWPEGNEDEVLVVNEDAIANELNKGYPLPEAVKSTSKFHGKIKK